MYIEKHRLDTRTALVVGGGGDGMGTATSVALAEAGAKVLIVDLNEAMLRPAEHAVAELGATSIGYVTDATDSRAMSALVEQAWLEHGPIHALVNVAGAPSLDSLPYQ